MRQASVAGNLDAMVEFAIAQFNGDRHDKDEAARGSICSSRRRTAAARSRRTASRAS